MVGESAWQYHIPSWLEAALLYAAAQPRDAAPVAQQDGMAQLLAQGAPRRVARGRIARNRQSLEARAARAECPALLCCDGAYRAACKILMDYTKIG